MIFFQSLWKAVSIIGLWLIGFVKTIKQVILREKVSKNVQALKDSKTSDEEDLALRNIRHDIYEQDPVITPEIITPSIPQTLPPESVPNEITIPKAPDIVPPDSSPK